MKKEKQLVQKSKSLKEKISVEINPKDEKIIANKERNGVASVIEVSTTKDTSAVKKVISSIDEKRKDRKLKKRISKNKNPFENIDDEAYKYLLTFVPDGHTLSDCGIDADYETIKQFMFDEWGVSVQDPIDKEYLESQKLKAEADERARVQKEIEEKLFYEEQLSHKIDKKLILTEMLEHKQQILQEISYYNAYCEPLTWCTLFFLMSKGGFHVLNLGRGGIGKSRSSLAFFMPSKEERLKSKPFCPFKKLGNIFSISGHITPKRFFEILTHNGKIIIDESFMLLQNGQIKNMLRSALYDGRIAWSTNNENNLHTFTGDIVFNSNYIGTKSLNDRALLDRCMVNNVTVTKDQLKVKLSHRRNYKPNHKIWELISNRLVLIRQGEEEYAKLSKDEIKFIDNYIEVELDQLPGELADDISMRVAERVENVFMFMKTFFGTLDNDLRDLCKSLSTNYFNVNYQEDVNSVIQKIILDPELTTAQKLEKYKSATSTPIKPKGKSRASFFNKKKELEAKLIQQKIRK